MKWTKVIPEAAETRRGVDWWSKKPGEVEEDDEKQGGKRQNRKGKGAMNEWGKGREGERAKVWLWLWRGRGVAMAMAMARSRSGYGDGDGGAAC